ncbi:hypothetical protein KKA14_16660, partial [bacterium]|nr:hypothetical protein [bacterium]
GGYTEYAEAFKTFESFLAIDDGNGGIEAIAGIDPDNPFVIENSFPYLVKNSGYKPAPIFMIHGNSDLVVAGQNSVRLCEALAGEEYSTPPYEGMIRTCGTHSSGVENRLHLIAGADHALDLKCFAPEGMQPLMEYTGGEIKYGGLCTAGSKTGENAVKAALVEALDWLQ